MRRRTSQTVDLAAARVLPKPMVTRARTARGRGHRVEVSPLGCRPPGARCRFADPRGSFGLVELFDGSSRGSSARFSGLAHVGEHGRRRVPALRMTAAASLCASRGSRMTRAATMRISAARSMSVATQTRSVTEGGRVVTVARENRRHAAREQDEEWDEEETEESRHRRTYPRPRGPPTVVTTARARG